MYNFHCFSHVIYVKNKEGVVEQMWEPVCSATRLAAGSNFMLHVLRLLACSVKKLATILIMLNTVDIASIIIQNWLVFSLSNHFLYVYI